jgi:Luciferase-like monooxygenase
MKIGFSLPNIGPIATAEAVTKIAQRAEDLGYSSLWTIERLLYPLKPQRPYPGTPDGSLPEIYRHTLDPLDSLAFVAGQTKKIRLGTSVLDMPYYNPVMLARWACDQWLNRRPTRPRQNRWGSRVALCRRPPWPDAQSASFQALPEFRPRSVEVGWPWEAIKCQL